MVKTLVSSLRKHKPQGTLTKSKFRTTPPSRQCSPTRDRDRREALPAVQSSRRQQGRLNRQRSTRVAPPARTRAASEACTRDLTSGTRVPVAPLSSSSNLSDALVAGFCLRVRHSCPLAYSRPYARPEVHHITSRLEIPVPSHLRSRREVPYFPLVCPVCRGHSEPSSALLLATTPRLAAAIHVFIWPLTRVMNKTKENLCFKIFS